MPKAGTIARALAKEFKPGFILVRTNSGHYRVFHQPTGEPVRRANGYPVDLPFSPRADMTPVLRRDLIELGVIPDVTATRRESRAGSGEGPPIDQVALARAQRQAKQAPPVSESRGEVEGEIGPAPVEEERSVVDFTTCALCGAPVYVFYGDKHMRLAHPEFFEGLR